MIKPLMKYTGGKYNEYDKIKLYFPKEINNYYEPFFGGGGIFFQLLNNKKIKGKCNINDYSKSLIDFYRCIEKETFKNELENISTSWEMI